MFMLQQMRRNLRKKLISAIELLGPQMFEDFEKLKMVKRQKTGIEEE
jgi:hypothetical protein